jgi:hypothetical protein
MNGMAGGDRRMRDTPWRKRSRMPSSRRECAATLMCRRRPLSRPWALSFCSSAAIAATVPEAMVRSGALSTAMSRSRPSITARRSAFGQVDGQHAAGRHFLEQAAAQHHDRQRVGQAHHAGDGGGRVLAGAVADDGRGLDAPALPQFGDGVLQHEQRRDVVARLLQRLGGLGVARRAVEHQAAQVARRLGRHQPEALVHRGAECGLVEQVTARTRIARAAAGEHHHHLGRCAPALPVALRAGWRASSAAAGRPRRAPRSRSGARSRAGLPGS